jgi:hypothetical protein
MGRNKLGHAMKTRRVIYGFAAFAVVCAIAGLFYSCSGGSGGASSGKVALYLTDGIADYKQVTATVSKVQLLHTGSGAACEVLTGPVSVNIANLAGVMQLVNVADCPAVPYNRIHIEFLKSVELTDGLGSSSTCAFTSYLDDHSRPNVLTCGADTCALDINGAVNVLARRHNSLALDFDLKNFIVAGFGTTACQVTMKVSPLHASDMHQIRHREAFTGLVSGLSTTDKSFMLTRGHMSFSVLYSGITGSQQPGLDAVLHRAQDDRLRVRVVASSLDLEARSIIAQAVYLKVEGTIQAGSLDTTAHTFSVVYSSGVATRNIGVDYSAAAVEGTLAEGAWVDVKLYGYNGSWFLARQVEVEMEGTRTED